MSGFFTLHCDLPREGPGTAADVHWLLAQISALSRICDAACGPGADLATFAEALPGAALDGIDKQAHFIAAARARLLPHGHRIGLTVGDYAGISGAYDLIWCAGAVYFIGIGRALPLWRPALAPGGHVAFSEPVLLTDPPSPQVREFWQDIPQITDAAGIGQRVTAAGFRTLSTRLVIGAGWAEYYAPMVQRIAHLRRLGDAGLAGVLDEAEHEIALWRQVPEQIAYLLSLVAPE